MKIIKQGKPKEKKKYRFECEYCGCIFEADENEVGSTPQIAAVHDNLYYKVICPCCNKELYK